MVYLVAADGIQQDDCVTAIFDDHPPEVFDRLCEWQLRQYVRQRCVETLLQTCANLYIIIIRVGAKSSFVAGIRFIT